MEYSSQLLNDFVSVGSSHVLSINDLDKQWTQLENWCRPAF